MTSSFKFSLFYCNLLSFLILLNVTFFVNISLLVQAATLNFRRNNKTRRKELSNMFFELFWDFKSNFRWDSFVKGIFQGTFLLILGILKYYDIPTLELFFQIASTLIG